jgi:predicted alpha/beta-hydrolase family hydrolase
MPEQVDIPAEGGTLVPALRYPATPGAPVLLLAHGAGAGQRSAFMAGFAEAMAARGVTAITFDFPYITARRRVPDRAAVLQGTWRAVIAHVAAVASPALVVIGGKAMGGRMASHVLADPAHPCPGVAGLVLLGYPLHPPGRPDQPRVAHLPALLTPTMVVQGSDDEFGTEVEVRAAFAAVPAPVDWLIVPGGDHSFKVPRRHGRAAVDVVRDVHDTVARWVRGRSPQVSSRIAEGL